MGDELIQVEGMTERERLIEEMLSRLKERFKEGRFLESELARIQVLDPVETPPSWVSFEVMQALNKIKDPWNRKKRLTVLRVAEALASGLPIRHVFDSDDTCSTPTWYGNKNHGQPAWREQPDIANALEVARRAAQRYYDEQEIKRLKFRSRVLHTSQDRLAELTQLAVESLGFLMVASESDETRRKAAVDVLTHAAPETAPKSQDQRRLELHMDGDGMTMRDILNRERRMPDADNDLDDGDEASDSMATLATMLLEPPLAHGDNGTGEDGSGE